MANTGLDGAARERGTYPRKPSVETHGYETCVDRCDRCGDRQRKGHLYYQPDGFGSPTPVLFLCKGCVRSGRKARRRSVQSR